MKANEQHIELITGYLQGTLTPEQQEEFDRLAGSGEIDLAEVRWMETQFRELEDLPAPEPDPRMGERFQVMLDRKREKLRQDTPAQTSPEQALSSGSRTQRTWLRRILPGGTHDPHTTAANNPMMHRLQTAAAIAAVFLAGLLLGSLFPGRGTHDHQIHQLAAEVHDLREIMLISLLDDASATERLRAVNISMEISSPQDRVIEALVQTLHYDPNINVRVAAVDALVQHGSRPIVRQELVRAITRQPSPIVQIALADAMIALQEPGAIWEFQKLLDQNEVEEPVRDKIEQTMLALL